MVKKEMVSRKAKITAVLLACLIMIGSLSGCHREVAINSATTTVYDQSQNTQTNEQSSSEVIDAYFMQVKSFLPETLSDYLSLANGSALLSGYVVGSNDIAGENIPQDITTAAVWLAEIKEAFAEVVCEANVADDLNQDMPADDDSEQDAPVADNTLPEDEPVSQLSAVDQEQNAAIEALYACTENSQDLSAQGTVCVDVTALNALVEELDLLVQTLKAVKLAQDSSFANSDEITPTISDDTLLDVAWSQFVEQADVDVALITDFPNDETMSAQREKINELNAYAKVNLYLLQYTVQTMQNADAVIQLVSSESDTLSFSSAAVSSVEYETQVIDLSQVLLSGASNETDQAESAALTALATQFNTQAVLAAQLNSEIAYMREQIAVQTQALQVVQKELEQDALLLERVDTLEESIQTKATEEMVAQNKRWVVICSALIVLLLCSQLLLLLFFLNNNKKMEKTLQQQAKIKTVPDKKEQYARNVSIDRFETALATQENAFRCELHRLEIRMQKELEKNASTAVAPLGTTQVKEPSGYHVSDDGGIRQASTPMLIKKFAIVHDASMNAGRLSVVENQNLAKRDGFSCEFYSDQTLKLDRNELLGEQRLSALWAKGIANLFQVKIDGVLCNKESVSQRSKTDKRYYQIVCVEQPAQVKIDNNIVQVLREGVLQLKY